MKTKLSIILLILLNACALDKNYYIKKVDAVNISTISIPKTSSVSQKIQIYAQAEAPNGCWSNLYFALNKYDAFNYELSAFGTFESLGYCAEMMVYKDSVIEFEPNAKGTYYFHITQVPYKVNVDTLIVE